MSSEVIRNQFQNMALDQLREKYLIRKEVGRNQASSLYQAVEIANGRTVALKVFRRKFSADPRFALNFRRHMRKVFELDNENLVSILDYGMADGIYYIASEWVNGQDLGAYLEKSGPLSELQAIAIASQVCQALGVVHNNGLLHLNLKPENILLTSQGRVKLSDIGLSGLISESGLSRTHVMMGRYHYIAPEQVSGQEPTPKSDIYSLGILLFEMLTGQFPFDARDVWDVLRMHVENAPPSIDQNLSKVSGSLAKIVQQTLQKSPEMRYPSAAALNAALTTVLIGSIPTQDDFGLASAAGLWGSLQYRIKRLKAFLQRPAPFHILGKSFPFGWLLLVQFGISFLIAFGFLSAVFANRSQDQANRSQGQEMSVPAAGTPILQKTIRQKNLLKKPHGSQMLPSVPQDALPVVERKPRLPGTAILPSSGLFVSLPQPTNLLGHRLRRGC